MSTQQSDDHIGNKLTTLAICFIVIEAVLVALRFLARHITKTSWGLDDFLILPALLCCWGVCIHSIGKVKDSATSMPSGHI